MNFYILLSMPLTIISFFIFSQFCRKYKTPLSNPMIFTIIFIAFNIEYFNLDYQKYYQSNYLLNEFIQFSLVSLGFTLHRQKLAIRRHWKLIVLSCFFACCIGIVTGLIFATIFQTDNEIIRTLFAKNTTTAVAIVVTENLKGVVELASLCVLFSGLTGSFFAYLIFDKIGIKSSMSKGLSIGAASHVLGVVASFDKSIEDVSFATISFIVCGIMVSIFASLILIFI